MLVDTLEIIEKKKRNPEPVSVEMNGYYKLFNYSKKIHSGILSLEM